jgi:hypothetical protein
VTLFDRLREAWCEHWPMGRDRTPMFLALAVGLVALLASLYRYQFATDITDETFSIALPYRFVLGDKPFVDEIGLQQTAGIVLYPFVWLYVKLARGTTGIVLFVRYVHFFVFKMAAAVAAYTAARRFLGSRALAIGVAFVPFTFTPHSIPNCGYNVIGMTMLAAGSLFAAAATSEASVQRADRLWVSAGALFAVMAFAYPPLGLAALFAAVAVPFCAAHRRIRSTFTFVGGGAGGGLVLASALAFGGVAGVKRTLAWGNQGPEMQRSMSATAKAMIDAFIANMPAVTPYLLAAIAIAWISRSRSMRVLVALAIVPAIVWSWRDEHTCIGAHRIVTYVGAVAPFTLLLTKPDRVLLRGAAMVVLPAYVAALACAVASTQHLDNAALGFYPAMVLVAILVARAIERAGSNASLALVPAAFLMLSMVTRGYDFVYRDAPFAQLDTLVTAGPWKGLRTTRDRKEMLEEIWDICRRFDQRGGRFTVLYEGPGLYLASRMAPGAHSVWEESYGDLAGWLDYWRAKNTGRGIIVKRRGMATTHLDAIMAPAERKVFETRHFIVYREG